MVDRSSDASLTFLITGLYAERQTSGSAASYWQLNSVPASGSATASGFTTYGPLVVSPSAFPGQLAVGTGTWVAQPDMADFTASHLSAISASAGVIGATSLLSGLTLTTNLPAVLANTGDNVAVARSLLGISALELLVLTVAALLAVARLLAAQREGETALLTARGATRWQLTRLTAAEVIPLSLVTALIGGVAGIWLARLLGSTLYRSSTAGARPRGRHRPDRLGHLARRARTRRSPSPCSRSARSSTRCCAPAGAPPRSAGAGRPCSPARRRAGADLALIVLAVLACWQLRRYSAVSTSASGPSAIDPVLVLAPALALAGGTVLTLRLLPVAARAVDRVSAAGRGLTSALAGWQFSRQPLRQGGAALLLVMAVATGTLALAQHQSWTRSAADQAAYVTGGDARVDLAVPLSAGATTTITQAPGVQAAMAVSVNQVATPSEVVAIDAAQAPKVALLRADQSSLPPTALLRSITPTSPPGGHAHQRQAEGGPVHGHAQPRPARLGDRAVHRHRRDRRRLPALIGAVLRRRPPARAHRLARRGQRRLPAPAQPGHPLLHAARETAEDPGHADRRRGDAQYAGPRSQARPSSTRNSTSARSSAPQPTRRRPAGSARPAARRSRSPPATGSGRPIRTRTRSSPSR